MSIHQRITDLSAAEIVGDLCAPVGSRYWCIGMRVEIQKLLDAHRTDHEGLSMCVSAFRQAEGWKTLADSKGHPFASYSEFCKTKRPHGLGCDPEHIDALVNEGRKKTAQEMAKTEPPLNEHGGDRTEQGSDRTLIRGETAAYLVRRLKRDAPSIAEALARGEYPSARAAGIAAGIVKVPSALTVAQKAFSRLSSRERQQFIVWLNQQEGGAT